MPNKTKTYDRVIFTPEVIGQVEHAMKQAIPRSSEQSVDFDIRVTDHEQWAHDSEEEFFADYRKPFRSATVYQVLFVGERPTLF